jgi:hypothetical protein
MTVVKGGGAMTDRSMEAQVDLLRTAVDKNIKTFQTRRDFNRARAFRLRLTVVGVGTLTTISLGLKPYVGFQHSDAILSSIALVLSASVPIFAAWEAFFDHRWLWIRYTGTLNALYAIRDELNFAHASGEIKPTQLAALFLRLQNTLEEVNADWSKQRKEALKQQPETQKK